MRPLGPLGLRAAKEERAAAKKRGRSRKIRGRRTNPSHKEHIIQLGR